VAVDELLVSEDVTVRMNDALREPGRTGGVVELRWIVRGRFGADEVHGRLRERLLIEREQLVVEARRVRRVGDKQARLGVAKAVGDRLVPVED
jgi:hypothetical protein